jgi:hypothetical protein
MVDLQYCPHTVVVLVEHILLDQVGMAVVVVAVRTQYPVLKFQEMEHLGRVIRVEQVEPPSAAAAAV